MIIHLPLEEGKVADAKVLVQRLQGLHVSVGQFKVVETEVLAQTIGVCAFRDDDDVPLQ